tara:strand:+ start:117 stop:1118 length:1002 start_codon:yes stop_codon:yes gene_type:complete
LILDSSCQSYLGTAIPHHGKDWGEFHFWTWKGFKCHWRLLGSKNKNPLIFIHGFGASSAHWRKNAAFFVNSGYRVYALDLIGFGFSEQPSAKKQKKLDNYFWSQQLVAFIEEIVQTESTLKVVLVGNSLGSLVAITVLSSRPDLVKALIASPLPDPAFLQPFKFPNNRLLRKLKTLFITSIFNLLPLELIIPLISRSLVLRNLLQTAYEKSVKNDFELLQIVRSPACRSTAARALRAMCIGMSLRPSSYTAPFLLKKLSSQQQRTPLLLVWGRQDNLVPLKIANMIIKSNPWLDLLVVENSGHCVHDESDSEFNQSALSWLQKGNLTINKKIS